MGFEPTVGCPTSVFKTDLIGLSSIPPWSFYPHGRLKALRYIPGSSNWRGSGRVTYEIRVGRTHLACDELQDGVYYGGWVFLREVVAGGGDQVALVGAAEVGRG